MNTVGWVAIVGWVVAFGIAAIGWRNADKRQSRQLEKSSKLQRALLRKQIAIQLLTENRFQAPWVEGLREVNKATARKNPGEFKDIAKRYFNNEETDVERDLCNHIRVILNYFEAISVAVLNEAADEEIIRWSLGNYFEKFDKSLGEFIKVAREHRNEKNLLVNFTALAQRWEKKPELARPTS